MGQTFVPKGLYDTPQKGKYKRMRGSCMETQRFSYLVAWWGTSGSCSRTGERLHSSDLQSLVEVHIHGLRSLGDFQVLQTASERCAGGESRLMNSS